MSEAARISCCILGCGRTFKRSALDEEHDEILCGKHYRVDPELIHQLKRVRARLRRADRLFTKILRGPTSQETVAQMERIWDRLETQDRGLWRAIKERAQQLQDVGFFAPKPRRRRAAEPARERLADPFEKEFQRVKRAMERRS
jgi:hypothetical protein